MRIGIFGGTFDPPHHGHLILAAEGYDQLKLDRLLFVLTPDPPHKQGQSLSPLLSRLAMVQAAIDRDPIFELSRVDIDRPPPHYAVDTVELLAEKHPGAEMVYLMGADSLVDLPTWFAPDRFVAACDLIGVMCRPGEEIDLGELEKLLPGISAKIFFVQAPLLEISSSEIRHRAAGGRHFRHYLPEPVYQLILKHNLYRIMAKDFSD
jgi:nicotinate-nucleotide adenylyltransferase